MPTLSASASSGSSHNDANSKRFRHRKISVKQQLRVYRPSDLKNLDQEEIKQRDLEDVETGVEKQEEKEVHLHRILQKGNAVLNQQKKEYIPTPDASTVWEEYDRFYTGVFVEPSSYIKFSATIEDCLTIDYSMDEIDESFLNKVNKGQQDQLTEDEFETLCSSFEHAISERQPFLSMDPESILSLDDLKPTLLNSTSFAANQRLKSQLGKEISEKNPPNIITIFDSKDTAHNIRDLAELIEKFGTKVYDHWKKRKIDANGYSIFPRLKFERPDENNDSDPYVCFRRRDVRHPRKTRRIDIINSQKLRSLHRALQDAKELALLVAKREYVSATLLSQDLKIFNQRVEYKKLKKSLDIKDKDDSELINPKRRRVNIIGPPKTAKKQPLQQISIDNHNDKHNKHYSTKKLSRKALEKLIRSGQKLTKQQELQILEAQREGLINLPEASKRLLQHQEQQSQQQQQQDAQNVVSHVYVKLPSSKIPDILLDDVDRLLSSKEMNARKFVQDRMAKRKVEDGNIFFNLTDDPYNPVFDVKLPKGVVAANAPFSPIPSSKFEIERSYYEPNLASYQSGNTNDIKAYTIEGEKLADSDHSAKKLEVYDAFGEKPEILTKEHPMKFRRRIGRSGIQYLDRRPNKVSQSIASTLGEFLDFNGIEEQELQNKTINVYDSKYDELLRMHDKWKFDSPRNDYGLKFSDEPSRLNQISNATQVIRFGTMLGCKSYEQLREATIKYHQDYIAKVRKQKSQQQYQQQPQVSGTPKSTANPTSSPVPASSKKGTPVPPMSNGSPISNPSSKHQQQSVPVAQNK